ncbi:MAG: hypothetical protein F4123_11045 [Gemmatimonadetes bacterium]|nr:hypothetical protein [Chloroflexota bacterium]MYI46895.1 hypothetical protein [Gemmatimonadota bacterium]
MSVVTLGDAVELVYGKSLPVRARRKGLIPVYGSNGVVGCHDEALVLEPTVIVGRKGSVGAVHLVSGPSFPIDTTYFVRPRSGVEIDICYASYALKRLDLSRLRTATGVPGLNREDAYREPFSLPPLAEQKRIAGILDAADALRKKRIQALDQLDILLQSTFLDMFGDPVTNPMGWDRRPLGEVIRVKSGDGLVSKNMAPDGKFPVYGGNGINGHHDSFMFEEPRVVLGRVGVNCGAVHLTRPRAWITDNALYVHTVFQPIDTSYLVAALKMANLNQYASRSAQPLISGTRIYPVQILMPSLDLQHRFAAIVKSVEQQRSCQEAHLAELDTLFASLQSRAFRGDL